MSVKVMAAVFEQSQSKGSARLVLLAMANEAHSDGSLTAYKRSRSHLARMTNLDNDTIRRAVHTLVELGELEVLALGAGRESSDYRILLPGLQVEPPQIEASDPSESPPRDLNGRGQPPQDVPPIIPFLPVDLPLAPVGRSQAKRRTQLPDDFELSDVDRIYALSRMPGEVIDSEFERFQNHHWGHGTVMLDWRRAWRTWAGNYGKYDRKPKATDTEAELDRVFAERAKAAAR